ncbi:hypothetical protein PRIPAC_97370 [Pristionchus pacificus]|uniref:Uncharacterized protein n=1 Tax=Pristionchus pacificus TaxID=54126 RepID=A0A2A6CV24_PRIPA|nr:hypothetical protein PRIPAC_97370 [Pristionchus pacificus]|eukprot:PDM81950.1 hypothetical protein PRIPAC_34104 [Pristionchus pacificus]
MKKRCDPNMRMETVNEMQRLFNKVLCLFPHIATHISRVHQLLRITTPFDDIDLLIVMIIVIPINTLTVSTRVSEKRQIIPR